MVGSARKKVCKTAGELNKSENTEDTPSAGVGDVFNIFNIAPVKTGTSARTKNRNSNSSIKNEKECRNTFRSQYVIDALNNDIIDDSDNSEKNDKNDKNDSLKYDKNNSVSENNNTKSDNYNEKNDSYDYYDDDVYEMKSNCSSSFDNDTHTTDHSKGTYELNVRPILCNMLGRLHGGALAMSIEHTARMYRHTRYPSGNTQNMDLVGIEGESSDFQEAVITKMEITYKAAMQHRLEITCMEDYNDDNERTCERTCERSCERTCKSTNKTNHIVFNPYGSLQERTVGEVFNCEKVIEDDTLDGNEKYSNDSYDSDNINNNSNNSNNSNNKIKNGKKNYDKSDDNSRYQGGDTKIGEVKMSGERDDL